MDIEDEKYVFDNIWCAFEDGYFISSRPDINWAVFFRIIEKQVYMYSLKNVGWCTEKPDEIVGLLEHISVGDRTNNSVCLTIDRKEKVLELKAGRAKHYYGR